MGRQDLRVIGYVLICSTFTLTFAISITMLSVFLPVLDKLTYESSWFSIANKESLMSNILIVAITLSIITIASFLRHIVLYSECIKTNMALYVIVLFPMLLILIGLQLVNMYYWISSIGKVMAEDPFQIAKLFTIVSLVLVFFLELFISVRNEVATRIVQAGDGVA